MGKIHELMECIETVMDEEKWSAKVNIGNVDCVIDERALSGYSIRKLFDFLVKSVQDGDTKTVMMWHDELKEKGADMHLVDIAIRTGKLPGAVKRMKEDVDEAKNGEYTVSLSGSKSFKAGAATIKKVARSGFKVSQGAISGMLMRWPSAMPHEDSKINIVKAQPPRDGEQVLIATLSEDVDGINEEKKVNHAQISKAAKKVTDNAVWDREMAKFGLDPTQWNTGFDAFVFPIIVATLKGNGVAVDNPSMQTAKSMLMMILKSLKGGKDAEDSEE